MGKGDSKIPAIQNPLDYARAPADEEKLARWFKDADFKIGIVLGKISRPEQGGLWAMDADDDKTVEFIENAISLGTIPATNRVARTRRGKHYYYVNGPDRVLASNKAIHNDEIHLDVKTGAAFSVLICPPSIRTYVEDGNVQRFVYEWELEGPWAETTVYDSNKLVKLLTREVAPKTIATPFETKKKGSLDFTNKKGFQPLAANEGRNVNLAQTMGGLVGRPPSRDRLLEIAHLYNEKNIDKLPDKEVETVVDSIIRTHARNHPDKTASYEQEDVYFTYQHVYESDYKPYNWLIKNSLLYRTLGMVFGAPGAGKGLFMAGLLTALAAGYPAYDCWAPERPVRILYLTAEDTPDQVINRYLKAAEKVTPDIAQKMTLDLYPVLKKDIALTETEGRTLVPREDNITWIRETIEYHQPELLVLDTFSRFIVGDENDNSAMTMACSILETLIMSYCCNIILVHHTNKDAGDVISNKRKLEEKLSQVSLRGASALAGAIRWGLMLAPLSASFAKTLLKDKNLTAVDGEYVMAKVVKKNEGSPETSIILSKTDGLIRRVYPKGENETDPNLQNDVDYLVGEIESRTQSDSGEFPPSTFYKLLGWNKSRAQKALDQAIKDGLLRIVKKGVGSRIEVVEDETNEDRLF
jgi:RecA-family ATPase